AGERLDELRRVRRREPAPDREQVALHPLEQVARERPRLERQGEAERGVQLVHLAVRGNPPVVLGDAAAAEQPRLPAVTRLGVDLQARGLQGPLPTPNAFGISLRSPHAGPQRY